MTPHHRIDITAETCPMTFVLVRLALDQMKTGEVLEIRLRGEEPRRNIPLTAQEQGHQVLGMTDDTAGESILMPAEKIQLGRGRTRSIRMTSASVPSA